jgi:PAS domain S-box-containing protein
MEAEQALRESMQKYQALFDQSAEGIYLLDLDGNIRDVNSVATMQIGYTKEELLRMTVYDINGEPDKLDRIIEEWKHWPSDKSFLVEDVHRHKDGTVFPVEIKTGKVHFGHDALILAMVRDVEQRRRLEEQLRQAQKMEAVGQLAGGVAHDFNNLLTVIRGYSDLLLMLDLPEKLKNPVEQIKYAGEKATQLTSQLLTFSRKQIIQPKILNLNTLITEHMKMLGRLLGEDIEIATLPHPDLANVNADPGQIEQVIMNIVINARDAMPMGGKLTIETRNIEFDATYLQIHAEAREGKFVMLAISDTGIGMDKATRQRVFEPFYTTKGREKGTGLGLATVFGIVKQNDGFIYVYSEPHQGTTFKIYLPAIDMLEEDDRDGHADGLDLRGQETILLVEDDISVREVTRSTLTDYGYRVLTASNGEEAIRLFQEHRDHIDLLLTDVIMPLMGGRELAETLSTEKPGLKIIFFSGYTDNSIVHHGVLDEGVEFIQKPYSHLDLAIKIRSVLDH